MNASELLLTGPENAVWCLMLAHGAGQSMDSPFMTAFAEGLAARGGDIGGLQVARFEFPYMRAIRQTGKNRPPDRTPVLLECWQAAIATMITTGRTRERLLIGGKSLGGRMASMVADDEAVAGLICLGYPFHPPGQPDKLRTEHLQTLRTPALICQGARDPFGSFEEVPTYSLSESIRLHWLEDGDHNFTPRKTSGRTEKDNWNSAIAAIIDFIENL